MLGVRPFPDRPEILALSMHGPVEAHYWTIILSMLDKQHLFAIVGPFQAPCSIEVLKLLPILRALSHIFKIL